VDNRQPIRFLAGAIAAIAVMSTFALASNLTQVDVQAMRSLNSKFLELEGGLSKISMSMISSNGASKELFCLMRLQDQATNVDRQLYPMVLVMQLSSLMADPVDESFSNATASIGLSNLSKALDAAKGEINRIFGSCGQSRLAYDQAKALMALVEETRNVILPMLGRLGDIKQK
jgi:hypothetical protein